LYIIYVSKKYCQWIWAIYLAALLLGVVVEEEG
jgi:hypothetical protein